ncbi:MAG: hypothetical protein ACRDJC_25485 [Thermomicrobiales bacterium]
MFKNDSTPSDPTIAELVTCWDEATLIHMYFTCRSVLADRDAWAVDTLVSCEESLADTTAEMRRRGHDWMTVAAA